MEPTEQLSTLLPRLATMVEHLDADQLYGPTPCRRFCVHDVIDHMIVLGGTFAYWFRGEKAPALTAPVEYGWVPKREFRATMEDLLDAVGSAGAMARTIDAPLGTLPGSTFARFVAFDGLIHGWDLASSTGQSWDPPPAVLSAVDDFARVAITAEMRDGDTFADEVVPPAGATPLQRLVAFSGRS